MASGLADFIKGLAITSQNWPQVMQTRYRLQREEEERKRQEEERKRQEMWKRLGVLVGNVPSSAIPEETKQQIADLTGLQMGVTRPLNMALGLDQPPTQASMTNYMGQSPTAPSPLQPSVRPTEQMKSPVDTWLDTMYAAKHKTDLLKPTIAGNQVVYQNPQGQVISQPIPGAEEPIEWQPLSGMPGVLFNKKTGETKVVNNLRPTETKVPGIYQIFNPTTSTWELVKTDYAKPDDPDPIVNFPSEELSKRGLAVTRSGKIVDIGVGNYALLPNNLKEEQANLKPMVDAGIQAISAAELALTDLRELGVYLEANQSRIGPFAGKLKFWPWATETKKIEAKIARTKQKVAYSMEKGVLRKEDEEKYNAILPTVNDEINVALFKVNELVTMITRDLKNYVDLKVEQGSIVPTVYQIFTDEAILQKALDGDEKAIEEARLRGLLK